MITDEPTWENAPERVFMDPDMKFSEWDKQYIYDVEYIRADIHEARIKELEDALSWYEQTVREFATATAQRAFQAELALDSDRGKTARDTLAKQHKGGKT